MVESIQLYNSGNSAMDAHSARRIWRMVITVAGRVVRVRALPGGGWRVRLADTGGALAAAEIRPSNPLPLPAVGARIVLRGCVHYDHEHGWYVVDPVEEWLDAG